jgi:hypothetical protein
LAGDRRDSIEVCVVVQDGKAAQFRCRGDQEVRYFATSLVLGSEESLNLSGAADVFVGRFDKLKELKGPSQLIPFLGAASGVPDLEVADAGSGQLATLGSRFDLGAYDWPIEAREDARVEQMR